MSRKTEHGLRRTKRVIDESARNKDRHDSQSVLKFRSVWSTSKLEQHGFDLAS